MSYTIDLHKLGIVELQDLVNELLKFNPNNLVIDVLASELYLVVFADNEVYTEIKSYLDHFVDISYTSDDDED